MTVLGASVTRNAKNATLHNAQLFDAPYELQHIIKVLICSTTIKLTYNFKYVRVYRISRTFVKEYK